MNDTEKRINAPISDLLIFFMSSDEKYQWIWGGLGFAVGGDEYFKFIEDFAIDFQRYLESLQEDMTGKVILTKMGREVTYEFRKGKLLSVSYNT